MVRLFLLQDSDYTQLSDAPITEEEKALWVQYRHYLRDFMELQSPQSPYDVIFPISPIEYLARKGYELSALQLDVYGHQGSDKDYLSSEYHFWKLSSNSLKAFAQRMSTYIALRSLSTDEAPYGRIEVAKYRGPNDEITKDLRDTLTDKYGTQESAEEYLQALITRIENGEI